MKSIFAVVIALWMASLLDQRRSSATAQDVRTVLRSDISGNDINCGQGGSSCRSCGDVATVVGACQANPSCVAFSYDNSCGYLKSAAGPTSYREGYTVYILDDKQAGRSPAPAAPAGPSPAPATSPPAVNENTQTTAAKSPPYPSPSPSESPSPSPPPESPSPSPPPPEDTQQVSANAPAESPALSPAASDERRLIRGNPGIIEWAFGQCRSYTGATKVFCELGQYGACCDDQGCLSFTDNAFVSCDSGVPFACCG